MTVEDSPLNRLLTHLRSVEARETDLGVGLQTIVDSASAFFEVADHQQTAGLSLESDCVLHGPACASRAWMPRQDQGRRLLPPLSRDVRRQVHFATGN